MPAPTHLPPTDDHEDAHEPVPDPDDHFDVLFDDADASDDDEEDAREAGPGAAAPVERLVASLDLGPLVTAAFDRLPSAADAPGPTLLAARHAGGPAAAEPEHDDDFPGRATFRLGRSHPAVTRLGRLLIKRGGRRFYTEGAGPKFGPADRGACAAFQRAQGWTGDSADGYPGPLTWKLLVEGRGRDIPKAGATLRSPVPGYRASYPFGLRNSRYSAGFHTGCDYAAPTGTPIVAVVAGKVVRTDNGGAYGRWTQIHGDDGHVWMYAHQSRRVVRPGQRVRAGQVIGYVGATGNVTGPHLHLEKSKHGSWAYAQVVNPTW